MEEEGEDSEVTSLDGISSGHSRVIMVTDSQFGHRNLTPVIAEPAKAPKEIKSRYPPQLILTPDISSVLAFA